MKKSLLLVLTLTILIPFKAFAVSAFVDAKITQIRVDGDGKVMIFFNKKKTKASATCVHSSYTRALGIDASTEGGKAVLSFALAAKTTDSFVTAYGLGTCGVYGGSFVETWNHGFMK